MSEIKFRVSLTKQRGIDLSKLGHIAESTERYLKLLCRDMDIVLPEGNWIAANFKNRSVTCDILNLGECTVEQKVKFDEGMKYVTSIDPRTKPINGLVSNETVIQYAKIGDVLDEDEKIKFGLYREERRRLQWKSLTRQQSATIQELLSMTVEYYGSVYGVIHALFKGAPQPHFTLRDSLTGDLIQCYYTDSLYKAVIDSLERKDAVIFAFGRIRANTVSKKIEDVRINDVSVAPTLSDDEYEKIFGCAPNIASEHLYDDE